jgi:hypothetical protein
MTIAYDHPAFPEGARVALVQRVDNPHRFGVAMKGARHVVALPEGYDGKTAVRWINGFILAKHPHYPPLLVDATRETVKSIDPETYDRLIADVKKQLGLARGVRILH